MTKKTLVKIEKILYKVKKIKYLAKFFQSAKLILVLNNVMKKKFPEFLLNFYEKRILND